MAQIWLLTFQVACLAIVISTLTACMIWAVRVVIHKIVAAKDKKG